MKLTLKNTKQITLSKYGECLSTEYKNIENNGVCFKAIPNSIQQGTWCPFCPKYKREKLCCEILTKYLGSPSLIRRPEFKVPNGPDFLKTQEYPNGLELDIPYYEYGFAIEVQGVQHEKYHEFFHRGDPNNFIKQQARDQLKKELCEENQIALRHKLKKTSPIEQNHLLA
ncbi:unnamed protein product [Rhizophagus irregularis]|nr:unnamed protein product [Rhizophagus irregularis]